MKPVILTAIQNQTEPDRIEPRSTIKLGINAHVEWFHVTPQIDGPAPQPVPAPEFTNTFGSLS